jgi:gamma-glutamylcyclotransferase (GGCT)/AIG2-like uncharacterized protein YtfP
MSGDSFLLFVYGTLQRGGVRHHFLQNQPFLGDARTLPFYALFDLEHYPGLVHRPAEGRSVRGELYRVETRLRDRLDREEGAPALFRLEPVALEGVDGPAYAYLYQRSVEGRALCEQDHWANL